MLVEPADSQVAVFPNEAFSGVQTAVYQFEKGTFTSPIGPDKGYTRVQV